MYIILHTHTHIGKYDGRGRTLIRSFAHTFHLSPHDFHFLETQLSLYLVQHTQHQGLHSHNKTEKTVQDKYWRYAKIGAVGLAAGGVLAVCTPFTISHTPYIISHTPYT
ncbi:hypothetical protein EON65_51755, partial [archaeon]